ncbi:MAG: tetratricopeptide repeat protein [Pseudomonadota bacterium]|jgi:tetratricopeptide (TPR) repeat protein|nr:tetratricopeptide repeat protein [Pseudomonadota bacterium]
MSKPRHRAPTKREAANEQLLQQAVRLHQQGQLDAAEAIYRKILRADPVSHRALNLIGLAGFQRGNFEAALGHLSRAATLAPKTAKYHYDLGVVTQTHGALAESVTHYQRALALNADSAATWENLGVALFDLDRNRESIAAFEHALALNPASLLALGNLATLRRWQGDHAAALALIKQGLALDPLNADLRMKRAETLLATGEFIAGWEDYAWRFVHGAVWGAQASTCVPLPKWAGEPLAHRRVLLHGEQGIGDEVMFASCLRELADIPSHFTLLCDRRLVPAMTRSFPFLHVEPNTPRPWGAAGEAVGADLRIPLGDLPRVFRNSAASFAPRGAFLQADPAGRQAWRQRLDALGSGLKIGISWRGGNTPRTRQARSLPLPALEPLFTRPGLRLISLQYGDCEQELATAPEAIRSGLTCFSDIDPLSDLDGMFALMAELDLVISVDNSTVHFGGALGVATWMLAPALTDWRWPTDGTDSRWYASVRLFRQPPGDRSDWASVVAAVCAALDDSRPGDRLPTISITAITAPAPVADTPAPLRTLLINDTSYWYHWGCSCTSLAIRAQLQAQGRTVCGLPIDRLTGLQPLPASREQLDDAAFFARFQQANADLCGLIADADEIVINGEGSLHGATHTSISLLYLAWIARRYLHRPVRIINHSCYPTGSARVSGSTVEDFYRQVYQSLNAVVVREPVSAALLEQLGIPVTIGFDCLPLYAQEHGDSIRRSTSDQLLIAGSVAAGPGMVEACAHLAIAGRKAGLQPAFLFGANANLAADDREFARLLGHATGGTIELCHATSEAAWLSAIASARLLVSGRFHYSIAAAWLGTPFIALDSNTPKMDGLMQTLGLGCRANSASSSLPVELLGQALALLDDPAPALISNTVRAGLLDAARLNFA